MSEVCFTDPAPPTPPHDMPRLAVLRMHSMTRLTVKEPNEPCVFLVNLPEPPSDMQLRRLVLAAPWSPVMIEAMLGRGTPTPRRLTRRSRRSNPCRAPPHPRNPNASARRGGSTVGWW